MLKTVIWGIHCCCHTLIQCLAIILTLCSIITERMSFFAKCFGVIFTFCCPCAQRLPWKYRPAWLVRCLESSVLFQHFQPKFCTPRHDPDLKNSPFVLFILWTALFLLRWICLLMAFVLVFCSFCFSLGVKHQLTYLLVFLHIYTYK